MRDIPRVAFGMRGCGVAVTDAVFVGGVVLFRLELIFEGMICWTDVTVSFSYHHVDCDLWSVSSSFWAWQW